MSNTYTDQSIPYIFVNLWGMNCQIMLQRQRIWLGLLDLVFKVYGQDAHIVHKIKNQESYLTDCKS